MVPVFTTLAILTHKCTSAPIRGGCCIITGMNYLRSLFTESDLLSKGIPIECKDAPKEDDSNSHETWDECGPGGFNTTTPPHGKVEDGGKVEDPQDNGGGPSNKPLETKSEERKGVHDGNAGAQIVQQDLPPQFVNALEWTIVVVCRGLVDSREE